MLLWTKNGFKEMPKMLLNPLFQQKCVLILHENNLIADVSLLKDNEGLDDNDTATSRPGRPVHPL